MKLKISSFSILLACLLASPLRAGNDPAPVNPTGRLTLREALRLAILQNPELAASNTSVRAAEGRLLQAGLLPNPSVFTENENLIGSGPYRGARASENTIQLSQLIELGGKRAARVRVAQVGKTLAGFDYEGKRLEVLVETTRAFLQTLAAQRRVALAEETARLADDLVPAIRRRVDAGAANAVEVTRAQNATATARIETQQAARDLATARQRLAASWGARTPRFDSVAGDLDNLPPVPSFETLASRLSLNPSLARYAAETAQRQAEITRAKAQAVPDVTAAVGPRYLTESNDVTVRLNLSVPLPIFDRNQGAIKEAQAELVRTGQLQQAAATQLTVSLGDAYRNLLAARQEIDTLQGTLLPGAENAFRQINEGYGAGRYSLLDVLDARRTLVGARTQLVNAQATYQTALAEIEGLTGQVRQAPAAARPSTATKPTRPSSRQ